MPRLPTSISVKTYSENLLKPAFYKEWGKEGQSQHMDNKTTAKGSWQQFTPIDESLQSQKILNECAKIKNSSEGKINFFRTIAVPYFFFQFTAVSQYKEKHREIHYEQALLTQPCRGEAFNAIFNSLTIMTIQT